MFHIRSRTENYPFFCCFLWESGSSPLLIPLEPDYRYLVTTSVLFILVFSHQTKVFRVRTITNMVAWPGRADFIFAIQAFTPRWGGVSAFITYTECYGLAYTHACTYGVVCRLSGRGWVRIYAFVCSTHRLSACVRCWCAWLTMIMTMKWSRRVYSMAGERTSARVANGELCFSFSHVHIHTYIVYEKKMVVYLSSFSSHELHVYGKVEEMRWYKMPGIGYCIALAAPWDNNNNNIYDIVIYSNRILIYNYFPFFPFSISFFLFSVHIFYFSIIIFPTNNTGCDTHTGSGGWGTVGGYVCKEYVTKSFPIT